MLQDSGTELFTINKTGTVPGKPGRMVSLCTGRVSPTIFHQCCDLLVSGTLCITFWEVTGLSSCLLTFILLTSPTTRLFETLQIDSATQTVSRTYCHLDNNDVTFRGLTSHVLIRSSVSQICLQILCKI